MTTDTLTLVLEGDVPLDLFADEVRSLNGLLEALSGELDRSAKIEWLVADLKPGSAEVTLRGEADALEIVERAVGGYRAIGRALERREPIPFGPRVREQVENMTRHINERGRITAIRFETPDDTYTVTAPGQEPARPALLRAYGTVTGKIQMLSSRRRLSFTLYDALFDRPVNCYLREGQEDLVRDKWERYAIVEGQISRDPFTGQAIAVREISDIQALPDFGQGDPYLARGVIPWQDDDQKPEVLIRRLRDEW